MKYEKNARINGIVCALCMVFSSLIAVLSLSGCTRMAAPNYKLSAATYNLDGALNAAGQYVIGPRDEIELTVWKCPELTTRAMVRPADGMVSLPLIGDVKASGLSPQELADVVGEKISYYVKQPRLMIKVIKMGEKKVFIFGEVLRPGVFKLDKGDRVVDLLAMAGGFNDNALKSGAYVIRGGYSDSKVIRINLGRLIHKGDMTQNVFLEEGDVIYIPMQEIENLNYALRKIFPSMYFAERLNDLKTNIMAGGYDWHEVWLKMAGRK